MAGLATLDWGRVGVCEGEGGSPFSFCKTFVLKEFTFPFPLKSFRPSNLTSVNEWESLNLAEEVEGRIVV